MGGAGVVVMLDRVSLFGTPYGTFFQASYKRNSLLMEFLSRVSVHCSGIFLRTPRLESKLI